MLSCVFDSKRGSMEESAGFRIENRQGRNVYIKFRGPHDDGSVTRFTSPDSVV